MVWCLKSWRGSKDVRNVRNMKKQNVKKDYSVSATQLEGE